MGWTERPANNYKKGKIDRKAELMEEFTSHDDVRSWEVLKCSMHGSTGYMAIKYENKDNPSLNCIFGLVCLTSVRDNYWFGYKDMDETMGPFCYDCPKSILDMLTPTDNTNALEWRKACRENKESGANKMLTELTQAKEGSIVKVTYNNDTTLAKKGDVITFKKRCVSINYATNRRSYQWVTNDGWHLYRMSAKMIAEHNPEWVEFIK